MQGRQDRSWLYVVCEYGLFVSAIQGVKSRLCPGRLRDCALLPHISSRRMPWACLAWWRSLDCVDAPNESTAIDTRGFPRNPSHLGEI